MLYEELEAEEWRPVVGWEGVYEVSSWGRVRRILYRGGAPYRTRLMRPSVNGWGYLYICMSAVRIGKKETTRLVHQLVAAAFLGPCPEGMEVNHKDGEKENCSSWNLEYRTQRENARHAIRNGLSTVGTSQPRKLTPKDVLQIRKLEGEFTHRQIAHIFGILPKHVVRIQRWQCWKHVA